MRLYVLLMRSQWTENVHDNRKCQLKGRNLSLEQKEDAFKMTGTGSA